MERKRMGNLADSMEYYLKRLLGMSASGYLEVKRKELAGKFHCVPSQVNYVLETRFTLEKGYLVESRRGGKGYLCIRKVDTNGWETPARILQDLNKGSSSSEQARGIIERLLAGKHISMREARLMEAALQCSTVLENEPQQGELRNLLLRRMILALLY
ncbi:MAG: CtsR family transcriptional regulator [Bacillota bacterium]